LADQTATTPVPAAVPPGARLAWQAVVDIGERQALGASPLGERFLVPILGGEFAGDIDGHTLHGRVLPGGADRQLLRADGIKELDALYEMQTHDGAVLTVHNQVLIEERPGQERYAFSHVRVVAPQGPHDWINRRVFIGTLHSLRPQRQAVCVRVWQLG